ncbi:MAG: tRNA uridine-5-carboxymethylaminomethyl(34) synthesis GTPase MnmE [Candidatus Omnitrophica bacterium]|nr:tRNA uridine-5-carboxymethylaminomethyl(34) synthesis GTPase MnmE [Candidatus Omnitrophota bacterium]MDD5513452.1 tRNA uridine-5-carboxymethylaminomethyl(34) synthesis GTPase MnmE [Candidatus Omnitrophota bacterium]
MKGFNPLDTIVAIATSQGEGAIGIVRLSGKDALKIADKIFLERSGRKPSKFKSYTVHYGWVVSSQGSRVKGQGSGKNFSSEVIDEVILTVMRAPKSYTREDVVEINCHGGIVALRAVLDQVLKNNARLAQPGEFTMRAFLNGRIDLAQAEAVLDIIRAKTDSALALGEEQLKGGLSARIEKIRKILLGALSLLEAGIDFPEEEQVSPDPAGLAGKLAKVVSELNSLLENSRQGKILREGLHVVICGKPNVGKSSLLNALLKKERCIVTPLAGTTRDTIEEIIDIRGIPVRIVDTAGIIEPRDLVEKKAIQRSREQIKIAELVILVFDGTKKMSQDDRVLIGKLKNKPVIAVINKIDARQRIEKERLLSLFGRVMEVSARSSRNIELLEEEIARLVYRGKVPGRESPLIGNLRQVTAVEQAQKFVAAAANSLDNKLSPEFIAQEIKDALSLLDELLGKRFNEELLDKIFADFCIGK